MRRTGCAQRPSQVHQPATLGIDRHPAAVSALDRLGHRPVPGERFDEAFGKSASEVDAGGILREVRVFQGAEGHDLRAALFQQLEVFRVIEVERVIVGDRQPHHRPTCRLALEDFLRHQRHQLSLVGDPQQQVEIDVAIDHFGEQPDHPGPFLVLRHRQ